MSPLANLREEFTPLCQMEFPSDLVLHFLPMSHKKDARLIWVNSLPPGKFFLTFLLWADFFEIYFFEKLF